MGMYHALIIMSSLLQKHNLTQEINLASDNLELIKRTKYYYQFGSDNKIYNAPHADIQSEINTILTESFPRLNILHVRGHQDRKVN